MPVLENSQFIPKTKRRTALSMGLYYSKIRFSDFPAVLAAGSSALSGNNSIIRIGSYETMSEAEGRDATAQYELDYDYPGEIADVIPGKPDRTLTIGKVILYSGTGTGDILEAIGMKGVGSSGWTIMEQVEPITLVRFEAVPRKSDGSIMQVKLITGGTADAKEILTYWEDCWLTANPKAFEISGDLKVLQSCTFRVGRKFVKVS